MPIKQKELNKLLHKLWDICLTVIAFIGAYFIKKHLLPDPFRGLTESPNYYIVLLMIIIIWYATFSFFNLYTPYRKQTFVHIFGNMIKAVATATFILIVCAYIFKITDVSRIMMGLFVAFDISLLALSKWLACRIISSHWRKESNFKNILIIGSRERARDVISAIENHLDAGYMIMNLIGPRPPIPAEVNDYEIWQRRRLSMKPGITCLWQISPNRNEMNFKKWMAMDLSYIDTWSLLLDFKIFLKTIQVMLTGRGR